MTRAGWVLVVLALLSVPAVWDSWWLLATSAVLWVAAWLLSTGYGRELCLCPVCTTAAERRSR